MRVCFGFSNNRRMRLWNAWVYGNTCIQSIAQPANFEFDERIFKCVLLIQFCLVSCSWYDDVVDRPTKMNWQNANKRYNSQMTRFQEKRLNVKVPLPRLNTYTVWKFAVLFNLHSILNYAPHDFSIFCSCLPIEHDHSNMLPISGTTISQAFHFAIFDFIMNCCGELPQFGFKSGIYYGISSLKSRKLPYNCQVDAKLRLISVAQMYVLWSTIWNNTDVSLSTRKCLHRKHIQHSLA